MKKFKFILLLLCCFLIAGCDGERAEELENQVEYLESQVEDLQRELANREDEASRLEQSLIWCDYCGEHTPEEYIFNDDGEEVCPNCVYGAYREVLDPQIAKCVRCGEYYWLIDSIGGGLCVLCGEEFSGECVFCCETTPLWSSELDFVLCEWCLASVYKHEEMQNAMYDWMDR